MSWLPRLTFGGWCGCDANDREFNGRYVNLTWRRWTIEIGFGREDVRA